MIRKNSSSSRSDRCAQYDDWICLLCTNHNYAFRQECNRCHQQTKQKNAQQNRFYEQQLAMALSLSSLNPECKQHPYELFPNVLLLLISNQPWEQYPQRREQNQNINVKWISHLIQE